MKKILFLIILLIFPLNVLALTIPNTYSEKVLIYDLTDNKVLYEKNSEEKTSIASITKILTTITAIEKIENLDNEIVITAPMLANIYWNASRAGLKVGDKVTYHDLLYATILPSGADATYVLAYTLSGSIAGFVEDMNTLAAKIGMTNSYFLNTTGLDIDGQYSTLEDVLKLVKYALQNPIFKEIFTTKYYKLSNGLEVKSTLNNYEDYDTSEILGSKTGYTDDAGTCLVSYFITKEHEILSITTNAPYKRDYPYHIIDGLTIKYYLDKTYEVYTTSGLLKIPQEEQIKNNFNKNIFWMFLSFLEVIWVILIVIFRKVKKKN